jgi:hypothetical protein
MATEAAKYCDVVMKGGITSGIVYPNAVLALAKEFRLKNIGGTSAGAIAAAVSAATALGDRRQYEKKSLDEAHSKMGFEGMLEVSKRLATQGFIYSLFQPAWGGTNAFRLVVILAGKAHTVWKLLAVLAAVFLIAPLETLLGLALFLGIAYLSDGLPGVAASLLPSLLCTYAGGAVFSILHSSGGTRRSP